MRVLRALDPVRGCAYRLGEVHFLLALESGRSPAWLYLQEPSLAQWACGLAWVSSVGTWVLLRPLSRGLPSLHFSNFPPSHGRPSMATYPYSPTLESPVSHFCAASVTEAAGQMYGPLKAKSLPPGSLLCFLIGGDFSFFLPP